MYVYTNYEPNPCKGQASEEKKKNPQIFENYTWIYFKFLVFFKL